MLNVSDIWTAAEIQWQPSNPEPLSRIVVKSITINQQTEDEKNAL